ncbi:diguanylate cyclase [Alishewanella longhuensis]
MNKMALKVKSQGLENWLIQGTKQLALLPVLFVLAFYMAVNYFSSSYSATTASALLTQNLQDIVIESNQLEGQFVNQLMTEVARAAVLLQKEQQRLLVNTPNPITSSTSKEHTLSFHAEGAYLTDEVENDSFIYFTSAGNITAAQYHKGDIARNLVSLYRSLTTLNPVVEQIYYISRDNVGHIYPYRPELLVLLERDKDIADHPFFHMVSADAALQQTAVWTPVYFDETGLGWMISALVPVLVDDKLDGVIGLDIPLNRLIQQVLNNTSKPNRQMLLLDGDANIIAMTDEILTTLGLDKQIGDERVLVSNKQQLNLNSLDNELALQLHRALSSPDHSVRLSGEGRDYLYSVTELSDINLKLISLSDTTNIENTINKLKQTDLYVLFFGTVLLFLITLLVLQLVLKRLKLFAKQISSPIVQLSDYTSEVAQLPANAQQIEITTSISEIAVLVDNFNTMTRRLADKSKRLHEADTARQLVEEKARIFQVMANTDTLTGLNNRKFVDSLLRHEAIRANRNGTPLTLMLLDVDKFKQINDTYGHQTGDMVLKRVAKLLKATVRAVDCAARWGGEEFLLVCPETALTPAVELAERIREQIELLHFEKGIKVTISIGVAEYIVGERTEKTIGRADERLYQAKNNGRNRVEHKTAAEQGVI